MNEIKIRPYPREGSTSYDDRWLLGDTGFCVQKHECGWCLHPAWFDPENAWCGYVYRWLHHHGLMPYDNGVFKEMSDAIQAFETAMRAEPCPPPAITMIDQIIFEHRLTRGELPRY